MQLEDKSMQKEDSLPTPKEQIVVRVGWWNAIPLKLAGFPPEGWKTEWKFNTGGISAASQPSASNRSSVSNSPSI